MTLKPLVSITNFKKVACPLLGNMDESKGVEDGCL
jgi:hypothetical protein